MVTETYLPCLVVYDIENDRVRHRVSETCLDFGLERFQKSAFFGKLTPLKRRELCIRLKSELGNSVGRFLVQPLGEEYVSQRFVHENMEKEEKKAKKNMMSSADPAAPRQTILRFPS